MTHAKITHEVVEMIARRDRGCVRCGEAKPTMSISHRRGKAYAETSDLNLMCGTGTTGCHGHIESNRKEAYKNGWLVRRGDITPSSAVPILYADGQRYLLDDQGGKTVWTPELEPATP